MRGIASAVCILSAVGGAWAQPASAPLQSYRVTGDRVNVRTRPEKTSEVVHQLQEGDTVRVMNLTEEWVEIAPPEGVFFWVHQDFIVGNKVQPSKLNVRSGAGINYHDVGTLERDDLVRIQGQFGEWLKIDPPDGTSLYVSREYVELQPREVPKPRPMNPAPPPRTPSRPSPAPPQAFRKPPSDIEPIQEPTKAAENAYMPKDLNLVPLEGQGRESRKQGYLKAVSIFESAPTRYRLVKPVGSTFETVCYIKGNKKQLRSFSGKYLTVEGPEYWVQGESVPVIIPEIIIPRKTQ